MTTTMRDQSQAEENDIRRRKVRKGTHSCWECRRRKIRCQFSLDDDAICIGCRARGSVCRSQEYIDETPAVMPERKVAQRLDRLESMMERLMEHVLAKPSSASADGSSTSASRRSHHRSSSAELSHVDDDSSTGSETTRLPAKENHSSHGHAFSDITEAYANPSAASARACPTALKEHGYETVDVFDTSTAKDTPVAAFLGIQNALATPSTAGGLTPESVTSMTGMASGTTPNSHESISVGSGRDPAGPNVRSSTAHKYRDVSKVLHALFPSQEDIHTIAGGAAALFVVSLFHSEHDIAQGRGERPESLTVVPPVTSHPTVLARRLLQITLCMQQIAPCFMLQNKLKMQESLPDTIGRIVSIVAHTVTANDDLIGNLEGIQCLVLMGQQQSNHGHLRKAWLSFRRALSLAQLMGLDHGNTRALQSCDPDHEDPSRRPTPAALWYRINACDRYVSLLLGLRAGTQDCDAGTVVADTDSPVERLGKAHMLLTGRIIERNHSRAPAALPYAITQAIDADLQAAAGHGLDAAWWDVPSYDPYAPTAFIFGEMSRSILQVNHYCIQILLHLPYMLRHGNGNGDGDGDGDGDGMAHSRMTCMCASRAVLRRFINFRLIVNTAFSCRHVDYASLIAAMTLIIGYLSPRPPTPPNTSIPDAFDTQLCQDRAMVEQVRDRMRQIGTANNDKLSQESAATIDQLLPLLYLVDRRSDATAPPAVASAAATPCVETASCGGTFACGGLDGTKAMASNPCATGAFAQTSLLPSGVRLNVPYFGTVSIHPNMATQTTSCLASSSPSFGLPSPQSAAPLAWQDGLSMTGAGSTQDVSDFNTMLVDFNTMDDSNGNSFKFGTTSAFPDLTGASDDWAMQGVDTTYWSLLNGGGGTFGGSRI